MLASQILLFRSRVGIFDDGYESFYTYAYPALKEVHATGSEFVIGAYIDMFNPDALRDHGRFH
ncbi:polysaccharide deacetylase family protein [Paenibacillus lutimineralis]|uniref:NodB homology domain-containing protein n=1 Tax=Paenibacillus lutimineralis TaxID=2707005 RepID=A0A3Q9ICY0_9BACL|nr:polysaccharide deacetylase family protein [Paenibacillus lutimineralis]AZS17827.1 hypothetical protein EI981_27585 [Paenibacillus lutimineralis]